jgi:hypothetical protein
MPRFSRKRISVRQVSRLLLATGKVEEIQLTSEKHTVKALRLKNIGNPE